jgi:hypothetical protein
VEYSAGRKCRRCKIAVFMVHVTRQQIPRVLRIWPSWTASQCKCLNSYLCLHGFQVPLLNVYALCHVATTPYEKSSGVNHTLKTGPLSGMTHPHNRPVTPPTNVPNCAVFHARQQHDKRALSRGVRPPSAVRNATKLGAGDPVCDGVPDSFTALG